MKQALIAVFAGAAFLLIYLFGKNFIVALIAGLLMLIVLLIVFRDKKGIKITSAKDDIAHINRTIHVGNSQVRQLMAIYVNDKEIYDTVKQICEVSARILDYVSSHKENIDKVNTFLDYYLPRLISIVSQIQKIERGKLKDKESIDFRNKSAKFLKDVYPAFENLLSGLYKNSVLDSSIDIDVMEQTLKSEGLIGDELVLKL